MEKPLDLLMWVGGRYYTKESFIGEANKLGCCRRISRIPEKAKFGVSRVFLVTDVSEESGEVRKIQHKRDVKKWRTFRVKKRSVPEVFGYFTISKIIMVGGKGVNLPAELKRRGVEVYDVSNKAFGEMRGCGFVVVGGVYLIDDIELARLKGLPVDSVGGGLKLINPTIVAEGLKRFRGWKYVDGEKLLSGEPIEEWFTVEE
jgi:hypothetical protein